MEEAAGIRGYCSFIEVWEGPRVVGRVRPGPPRGGKKHEPELLAEAMEQMGQAFAIFDSQDLLVAFNQRYLQVRSSIGGAVVQGVKWLDLVKATLDRRLLPEAIGREKQWLDWRKRVRGTYSVIRELPDATIWQVDERRMPSGVVVVWTDVSKLFGRTRDEVLAGAETPRKKSYLSFPHDTVS
jgi:PAS fold